MSQRDQLTNETLKSLFKNNFDLSNYAIKLAEYYVKSGHEVNVDELLEEIRRNPYQYRTEELQGLIDSGAKVDDEEEETKR